MSNKSQIIEIMENSIHMINENYNQPLHLNTLARQIYLSPASYSRYFLEITQCSFSDYINKLRVSHAKKDLIWTNHPLTQIALDQGFSNSSVFSRVFKSYTGTSPSDFRKKYHATSRHPHDFEPGISNIHVTQQKGVPMSQAWLKALNAGNAALLLRGDCQQTILSLTADLGFRYVRLWNIFSMEFFPHGLSDLTRFEFKRLDTIFDFLIRHGLKPWINLTKHSDFPLDDISDVAAESDIIMNFSPMKEDMQFYENFLTHWCIRYGREEVSQWIFECWYNDINITIEYIHTFIENFKTIRSVLKKRLPEAKLGILANAVMSMNDEIDYLLSQWPDHTPPDFISAYCFPYIKQNNHPVKLQEIAFTQKCIQSTYRLLMRHHMDQLPITITQWNITVSSRNAINDSCIAACMMLNNIEETLTYEQPILYCYASDLCTTGEDPLPAAFGGMGLLSAAGFKKPVYYALRFFKQMSPYCLTHGPGYIITTDHHGQYDLLLFNTQKLPDFYYQQKGYEITTNMVLSELYRGSRQDFHIDISLTSGGCDYRQTEERLIPGENDLLGQLKKFNEISELSLDEIEYLNHMIRPSLSVSHIHTDNAVLKIQRTLEPYEICRLCFTPI